MNEIFKRDAYLGDAFGFVILSVGLVLSYYALPYYFPRFILDSSVLMFLMLIIHIGIWFLTAAYFISSYYTTLIVSDEGIEVKYRKGGWSCSWQEINEWKATVDAEGTREIVLTAGGDHHKLPSEIIDNKSYRRQIKSILHQRCGEPSRSGEWNVSDDPDG